MSVKHRNLKGIVTASAVFALFCLPLAAGAADPGEEAALLAQLAEADSAEAQRLDRELQALWSRSGSASMDLLLRRGRDALDRGEAGVAIEHLTALTDHAPDFAEGWYMRASAFFQAGLYGPALADLERALALNPNNYDAIFGLGSLLEVFGDSARAYQAYEQARDLNPHHEDVIKAMDRLRPEVEGKAL